MSNELEKLDAGIVLRGDLVPYGSDVYELFVDDGCREAEEILSTDDFKYKYGLSDAAYEQLGSDERLVRDIKLRMERRVWNGLAAKECAAFHFAKAPHKLGKMIQDPLEASARKIEATKELRSIATSGSAAENAGRSGERFLVTIITGSDRPPTVIDVTPSMPMPAPDHEPMPPIVIGRSSPEGPEQPPDAEG